MKTRSLNIALIVIAFLFSAFASAQQKTETQEKTRILFILDASKSMSGQWQRQQKFKIATSILSQVLDSLKKTDNLEVALRVYGHQRNYPPQNCNDSKLEVAFANDNFEKIKERLKYITPRGTTPIAMSLERAKSDFGDCLNCRNVIILITDGIEECGGDLCEVSKQLQNQGIALKPFVIGIGANTKDNFNCVGTYFNAPDSDNFSKALNIIITKVLSKTSLQVNLLDKNGKPKESNVNMAFTDLASGKIKYNFIHTLNHKGLPDTIIVDPLLDYSITLNTLPPIEIDSFSLSTGKHNIIYANCLRGNLKISLKENSPMDFNPAIIVKNQNNETVNIQSLNNNIKYVVGNYNIEVLTLPVTTIRDVEIEADNNTNIQIENPGILAIQKSIRGFGVIYQLFKNKQIAIININENSSKSKSIYLQPGNYRLIFRPLHSSQSVFTQEEDFKIISGKTTKIKL